MGDGGSGGVGDRVLGWGGVGWGGVGWRWCSLSSGARLGRGGAERGVACVRGGRYGAIAKEIVVKKTMDTRKPPPPPTTNKKKKSVRDLPPAHPHPPRARRIRESNSRFPKSEMKSMRRMGRRMGRTPMNRRIQHGG